MRPWRTTAVTALLAGAALLVPAATVAAQPSDAHFASRKAVQESDPQVLGDRDRPYDTGRGAVKRTLRDRSATEHTITVRAVDQHGAAVAEPIALVLDLETGAEVPLTLSGNVLTGTAPPGDYAVVGIVVTGNPFNPEDLTLYGDPTLTLSEDVDITLDSRTATEVEAVSPSPAAEENESRAALVQTVAGQQISTFINGDTDTSLHAFPSASTTRPYHFLYMESQSEPPSTPDPRAYHMAFPNSGRIPEELTFTATPASLAQVNTTYSTQGVPGPFPGGQSEFLVFDAVPDAAWGTGHSAVAPSVQRVFFTADGVQWKGEFVSLDIPDRQLEFRRFAPGGTYAETWNKPAFGPTVQVGHGDTQLLAFPIVTDTGQVGHENASGNQTTGTTGSLTLYRNGVNLGSSENPIYGEWATPSAGANFRLDMAMTRKVGWSAYATSINARWTFRSAGNRPDDPFENMRGLIQPRITGDYDERGRAPAGASFPLDVRVQRAEGGSATRSVSLRASFNDGATWTTVPLTQNGTDRWTGNVNHPTSHNGYVALRFTAADSSGNSVTQTVTRAYGLR